MKIFVLLALSLVLIQGSASSQSCSNQKVQSSVVTKPTDAGIIAASCSTLVVAWKGNVNQTYAINGTLTDPLTNLIMATGPAENITGDDNFNYTATIPVKPGTSVRFNIVAMSVIDNRTFVSYPLRNDDGYMIPNCDAIIVNAAPAERKGQITSITAGELKEELLVTNRELAMYPNPVTDILNIRWKGQFSGQAKMSIMDISGKVVKTIDFKKEQAGYLDAVPVSSLPPGTYILYIKMQGGKSLVTKFLKN